MSTSFNKQLTLFDIQNYEYSILISPSEKVKREVISFKKRLNTIMEISDRDLYSTPHISLLKLKSENNDSSVICRLRQALMYSEKFQINLKGLGYFDNKTSNTVYVKIDNPEPITSVYKTLLTIFAVNGRELTPHLTIARGISASDLNKIRDLLPEYRESFSCNIIVLKKPVGDLYDKIRYTKIYDASLN